jgi:S-(hydroxymethyl)glutathione dehydrogenase/alcohol dehydrogenase
VIQGSRIAGAAVIVGIDPVAARREASLAVGATHVVDPAEADPVEEVLALTNGRGVDYSFEVVGRVELIQQAWELARRAGTVTLVGMPPVDATLSLSAFRTVFSGKRLVGSVMGDAQVLRDFPRFIHLAEVGKLDLGSLVSNRIKLDGINDGLDALHRVEGVRTVVL